MSAVRIMPISPKIEQAHARKHENSPRPWCPLCAGSTPAPVVKPARTRKPAQASVPTPPVKSTPTVPAEVVRAAAVLSEFAQKYEIVLSGNVLRALAQAGVKTTPAQAPKRTRKAPAKPVSEKSVLDGNVEWIDGDVLVAVA